MIITNCSSSNQFRPKRVQKGGNPPELFTALAGEIKEKYNSYKHIYTDGSKMDEKVAAAAVTDSEIFVSRLADIIHQFSQLRLEQSI